MPPWGVSLTPAEPPRVSARSSFYIIPPAQAGNITGNTLILRPPVSGVLPEYFRISKKICGLFLNHHPGEARVHRVHHLLRFKIPVSGILGRIQRQRHEPFEFARQEFARCVGVGKNIDWLHDFIYLPSASATTRKFLVPAGESLASARAAWRPSTMAGWGEDPMVKIPQGVIVPS